MAQHHLLGRTYLGPVATLAHHRPHGRWVVAWHDTVGEVLVLGERVELVFHHPGLNLLLILFVPATACSGSRACRRLH